MSLNPPRSTTSGLAKASLLALMLIAACAAPPPPERPVAPSSELTFDAGVDYAIDDLLVQARRLPAFNPAPGILKKDEPVRGVIAVDPAIDGNTGQNALTQVKAFAVRSGLAPHHVPGRLKLLGYPVGIVTSSPRLFRAATMREPMSPVAPVTVTLIGREAAS